MTTSLNQCQDFKMCLYPRIVVNQKYVPNKKNGGRPPFPVDPRVLAVAAGCGRCIECRKQKARAWQIRISEDIKKHRNGKFVTLTLSTDNYKKLISEIEDCNPYTKENKMITLAMRRFLERWRKKYKKSVRHFMISELGGGRTEHIHLHGIIYCSDEQIKELDKIWSYGYVWKGYEINGKIINFVNDQTGGYITKYIQKMDEKHKYYNPVILCSKGIGNNYKHDKSKEYYRNNKGYKMNLPTYYKNKHFNDDEREKQWIELLNKEKRFILGREIDISNGMEEYFKRLAIAQETNRNLGYGDNGNNWKRKYYEMKHREEIQQWRLREIE